MKIFLKNYTCNTSYFICFRSGFYRNLALLVLLFVSIFLEAQSNVRAWQADGQVWVVWEFDEEVPEKFAVYESGDSEDWKLIGTLFPEHTIPFPIRKHLGQENQTWKIPDGNGAVYTLSKNEGLFVKTIRIDESLQYGILGCDFEVCNDSISSIQISNILTSKFDPAIKVKPHLQNEVTFGSQQKTFIYSFWPEGRQDHENSLPGFPIMGNSYTNGWPQYFAVWTGQNADLSSPVPAVNWLHGGSGNFSQYLSGKRAEINIEPDRGVIIAHHDDFYRFLMGQKVVDESNSWWFGWAKSHNPFEIDHSGPSIQDTIINYSQRKIKWINDWLIEKEIIDPHRISIQGYSVGSAGAFAMLKSYPDFFSTGTLFSCGQQGPDNENFGTFLLGSSNQNLPTNLKDNKGSTLRMHDVYNLEDFITNSDLPLIQAWHGKNDRNPTMAWDPEFLDLVRNAKEEGIGYSLFWDERDHPIQGIRTHWSQGPEDENQTAKDDAKYQMQFRNDHAYPVFFNYSDYPIHHSDPGNGMRGTGEGNGDDWGTWGGYHEFDVSSIIDRVDEWSCVFFLSGESARILDRYAGSTNCIQSDFTVRRLQNFKLAPLEPFKWVVRNSAGEVLGSGQENANQEGRPVLRGIPACKDPQKLRIELSRIANAGCEDSEELSASPGIYCQSLFLDGVKRDFLTIVPDGYSSDDQYGLLLAFHGGGGNFQNFAFGHVNENGGGREEFHEGAEEEKIILVYPQALIHPEIQATSWNTFEYDDQSETFADDFRFVVELLEHHASILSIDKTRVYASGYSKGGDFAQLIGRKLACYFAGVTSVGSSSGVTHELGSSLIQYYPLGDRPIPVMMIKGDQDFKRPWNGGANNNDNLVPSGEEDIAQWILNNGCDVGATITEEIPDILTTYSNNLCDENAEVRMLRGHNLEHVWPDEDDQMGVNANAEFIQFLSGLKNDNSCLLTDIDEDIPNEEVNFWPNPVKDFLWIEGSKFEKVEIIDMQGRILLSRVLSSRESEKINVSRLDSGIYSVRIHHHRKVQVESFVKY